MRGRRRDIAYGTMRWNHAQRRYERVRKPPPPRDPLEPPECKDLSHGRMVFRRGIRSGVVLFGCRAYPDCREVRWIPAKFQERANELYEAQQADVRERADAQRRAWAERRSLSPAGDGEAGLGARAAARFSPGRVDAIGQAATEACFKELAKAGANGSRKRGRGPKPSRKGPSGSPGARQRPPKRRKRTRGQKKRLKALQRAIANTRAAAEKR